MYLEKRGLTPIVPGLNPRGQTSFSAALSLSTPRVQKNLL